MPRQSTDSIADNSGRIHRKSADFSPNHPCASVISNGRPAPRVRSKAARRNFLASLCVFLYRVHVQAVLSKLKWEEISSMASPPGGLAAALNAGQK
jgi:hypothetical protein